MNTFSWHYILKFNHTFYFRINWTMCDFLCSSAPCESSRQQSLAAATSESLRDDSGVGPLGVSTTRGPAEWECTGSPPQERSQPEGSEDPSGDCRRAEPAGEEGVEGQSQPAPSNQDSDDSDDDPILIPPARFRGQGQRYYIGASTLHVSIKL